jgi:hypothetical protein
MKRIILICLIAAICCIQLQSHAQLLGKWAIPTGTGNSPIEVNEVLVMEFLENDLIQHSTIAIPGGLITAPDQIGDGAFDSDYNHEFSVASDYLFYENQNVDWISNPYPEFLPECQMVSRPDNTDRYYFFYSIEEPGKNFDNHLFYNEMWRENNSVQVGPQNGAIFNTDAGSLIAFAITEKNYFINGDHWAKYIYISSGGFNSDPQYNAGLRKYEITENGFDFSSMEEIVTETHQDFTEDDFSAYNLELKIDENENTAVAWISQKTNICQQVYVAVNENTYYKHILNKGRIGGIEFSSLDPNILYVSCPDSGIVALNYTSGEHSVLPNSQDFGHTFLQTAPDGHIYALNDGGYILGRISMQDGSFDPDCFTIPNSYMVSTFRVFDNTNYYILPENHRRYNPLIVTVDTIPESCPGYADGSAIICVSGGTPAAPPDPEYNITCTGPGGNSIDYDYYDPATGCFHFENLTAGFYTFSITDDIGTFYEGSFTIGDTYYDTDIIVIDYDMAWTDHYADQYRIEFLLLVKDNAVLDIDNTILEFGPDGKVIIEPGARINADNSVFRNLNCEPYYKWKGIEVWGDTTTHQYTIQGVCAQGYLYLNNSTVMHAENGVSLWAEEDRLWNTAGGIVKAVQSDFIDNTRAVHFVPYENTFPPTGEPCNNLSNFKLCNFSLDENYIDHTMFYKHVDLHRVNGLGFYGCNFSLTATSGVSPWNNGIASYGSGFKVDEGCMPPCFSYEPSTFEGFYRALSVLGTEAPYVDYPFEVRNSDFANNVIGIFASECEWPVIVDNTFVVNHTLVTDGICDFNFGIGIDMYRSYGFAIEDNIFNNNSQAGNSQYSGIRVDNCPSDHDIIYRNIFNDLSYGNYAEGTNRQNPNNDQHGVEYRCNQNNNNIVDFIVTDEFEPYNAMIRTDHGSSNTASGNTFSEITHNDIWHFRNEGYEVIDWFYCDDQACADEEPINVWTHDPVYFHKYASTNANSCPDHYGGGGGINITLNTTQKLTKQQEYAQNLADYNSVMTLYESLIDGGNTDAELMDITLAQPDDMWILRSQLLGHSPHLSQEVLRLMADRTDVFPNDILLEILSANPDELKVDTLLLYLEQKEDPLPDYMISILYQVTQNVSYKTILKREMAQYYAAKSQAAQDILRSLAHDSIFDALEYRNWLDNFGGLEADKQIVAGYFAENDTASAFALLNMLADIYQLEGNRLSAFNDYKDLVLMQYAWQQQGRSILELDSTELLQLSDYAYNSDGTAKAVSRNILSYLQLDNFCNCMHLNDSSELKTYVPVNWNMFDQAFGPEISVQPNPANTWAAFNYKLNEKGLLRITDASGKCIHEIELTESQGQYVWDTRSLKAGVYVYTLQSAGLSKSGKLIIR